VKATTFGANVNFSFAVQAQLASSCTFTHSSSSVMSFVSHFRKWLWLSGDGSRLSVRQVGSMVQWPKPIRFITVVFVIIVIIENELGSQWKMISEGQSLNRYLTEYTTPIDRRLGLHSWRCLRLMVEWARQWLKFSRESPSLQIGINNRLLRVAYVKGHLFIRHFCISHTYSSTECRSNKFIFLILSYL